MPEVKLCAECGKETDCPTTCTYPNGGEIELCPTCLKNDGSFCLSCGLFCSGIESFDFIHPGYCDDCWDENQDYDEPEDDYPGWEHDENDEEDFPNGSLDY